MRNTTPRRSVLLFTTVALASAVAFAGPEPIPTRADKAKPAAQPEAQGEPQPSQSSAADPGTQPESAESTGGTQSASAANASAIARWMRAIGGRICMGPTIDIHTRVSRPNPNDDAQRWRVSVPTFASARMSAPPKRAHQATPQDQPGEASAEQSLAAGTEPAAIPD